MRSHHWLQRLLLLAFASVSSQCCSHFPWRKYSMCKCCYGWDRPLSIRAQNSVSMTTSQMLNQPSLKNDDEKFVQGAGGRANAAFLPCFCKIISTLMPLFVFIFCVVMKYLPYVSRSLCTMHS
ncbi:hypothetical protein EUGRSUZ_D01388 [Eucalyptus grandis]|uniref:Secreted protein n=2 Tax=Eucalyptus grandis TaxID=71139 RepID=A0A059CFA1_EUCGR|nr:hypothetical protein EUGRSUZ_D01388 [Eucalyptus grandis]